MFRILILIGLVICTTILANLLFSMIEDYPQDKTTRCDNFCGSDDTLYGESNICICDVENVSAEAQKLKICSSEIEKVQPEIIPTPPTNLFVVGDCWMMQKIKSTPFNYGTTIHILEVGQFKLYIENWDWQLGVWTNKQLVEKTEVFLQMEKIASCPN